MLSTLYTDQPYCAVNPRSQVTHGEVWTCVITASIGGGEGSAGEAVYSVHSIDFGKSWSEPVALEGSSATLLPNAYGNIIFTSKLNRLYVVYNMNLDNVTSPTGKGGRADELGYFVMRFSEDDGRSVIYYYILLNSSLIKYDLI